MQQHSEGTLQRRAAFTLIELLIVVAIIAILAAIAVPNFLEAQTRSKVSRVKADMRSAGTGIEAYSVDHGAYPTFNWAATVNYGLGGGENPQKNRGPIGYLVELTTPVAYLTSVSITDPFIQLKGPRYLGSNNPETRTVWYHNIKEQRAEGGHPPVDVQWCMHSWGPDWLSASRDPQTLEPLLGFPAIIIGDPSYVPPHAEKYTYDATNGTKSSGDIFRWQGQ